MELIRILSEINDYQQDERRFQSGVFTLLDGGVSVVSVACVEEGGTPICNHLREYYPDFERERYVIWRFEESILPGDYKLVPKRSKLGDDCHYNIEGLSNNRLRKFFKKYHKSDGEVLSGSVQYCNGAELLPYKYP